MGLAYRSCSRELVQGMFEGNIFVTLLPNLQICKWVRVEKVKPYQIMVWSDTEL